MIISPNDNCRRADNASTVYVRWGYEIIADRAHLYSGWNIDDVKLNGRLNKSPRREQRVILEAKR